MAVVQKAAPGGGTGDTLGFNGVTSVLVRDVGSKIFYVDPTAAPFTLLTSKAGSKVANNPKFEWYEKSLRPKKTQADGAALIGATSITVDDGTTFQVGDLVLNPRTSEIVRVTANTSTTITVVRAQAGTAAVAVADNDDLFVIGSANAEGGDVGTPDEWQEVQKYNYTQIFRRPFGATRTREGAESYFGQTRPRLRAEKAIEHAIDMERAMLFGGRAEDTSGTQVRRTSGGFFFYATSNVKDAGGTLTEQELEDWLADVFATTSSGDSRTLFASPKVISVLDMLGLAKLQTVPSDKTYGISVKQYLTSHGTLNIVKHRLLENGAGGNGFGNYAIAVDTSRLMYRPYSNGATKLLIDRQSNGVDGYVDEYLTEAGWEIHNPAAHGTLKNVTA